MESQSQLPREALSKAAEAAYEFHANLLAIRNPRGPWVSSWDGLNPSEQADWRAMLEAALPAIISADRHELVKWMHAESDRLAALKPGLTAQESAFRRTTSESLVTAIAHMAAYGQDGLAKMKIAITDEPGSERRR